MSSSKKEQSSIDQTLEELYREFRQFASTIWLKDKDLTKYLKDIHLDFKEAQATNNGIERLHREGYQKEEWRLTAFKTDQDRIQKAWQEMKDLFELLFDDDWPTTPALHKVHPEDEEEDSLDEELAEDWTK